MKLIILLTILFFLIIWWGFYSSNQVLKLPRFPLESNPKHYGYDYENVEFITEDNLKIKGWFIKSITPSEKTIILLHGWGADKGNILPSTLFLNHRGNYNLLYFDFRNHGESEGNVSSLGFLESKDVEAAIKFLKEKKSEFAKDIGILGISMGGSVGILTAGRNPQIKAIVVESPFDFFNETIYRFAKIFYGFPKYPLMPLTIFFINLRLGFNPNKYSSYYFIEKISPRPIFLIAGAADVRIPKDTIENLYKKAKEPKQFWIVPDADHCEAYYKSGIEYEKKVLEFFKKYL